MKLMRTVLLMLICVLALSFGGVCSAAGEPIGMTYSNQSYVAVTGNAGAANAGKNAILMLVDKNADIDNIKKSDIGYISQEKISEDGSYAFEFEFSGFTYDDNWQVNNYLVILNVNGTKMTSTIMKATAMSDMFVSFNLDLSNFGRVVAEITNEYNLKDLSYRMMIAFYEKDGSLLDVKICDKFIGDDNTITYGYDDIPEAAGFAKAFLWESFESMIPLAEAKYMDINAHTSERSVMTMSISPGANETERNFAWYDIPGIENAKIQIAEKVNGDATDFESGAVIFDAECGEVSAAEHNGTPLYADKPDDDLFTYANEYSWAKATVTGLEHGKEYVYRVGDKLGWCKDIYDFKTDEAPESGFDFLIFTDEHFRPAAYDNATINATNKAFELLPDASLVLALGDNVDLPWRENAYTDYFSREHTNRVPIASIPGPTHDMISHKMDASLFGYHFNMPNQSTEYGYIENVCGNYWFEYGDVQFIALTYNLASESCLQQNKAYVEKAVDECQDAKWRILFTHLPFGTVEGSGNYQTFFTKMYESIGTDFIAENDIDIALMGHQHLGYRSYPMAVTSEGVTVDTGNDGINFANPSYPVYLSLNPLSCRNNDIEKQGFMAFADTDAVHGVASNAYLSTDGYHTTFAAASVKTTDTECSLEIKTYRNIHAKGSDCVVTDTELLDTFKITKTK